MKKRTRTIFLPLIGLNLLLFLLISCGGGGGGGGTSSNPSTPPSTPAPFASTIKTVLASASVLPTAGGLVAIKSQDNETNGASLQVPPRSVSSPVTISMGTADSLPAGSPFGVFGGSQVGKLFATEPSGLTFSQGQEAVLSLPIPPGEGNKSLYVGRFNPTTNTWENLGGTIVGGVISTKINHLSFYGVFYAGKSDVRIINNSGPQADLGIELRYISGPAIPPNTPQGTPFPSFRPLQEGGITLKDGQSSVLSLLPGNYHFLVSYPHPQPGIANSLFFTIPVLTSGADDGGVDQTITITLNGATSSNSLTNASINFPGNLPTSGTNLRPVIACTAIAPAGVPVIDLITGGAAVADPLSPAGTRLVGVGGGAPVKIEQLSQGQTLTLLGKAHDPEASNLRYFWTFSAGGLPIFEAAPSDQAVQRLFSNPNKEGVFTVSLTVYDPVGLFDECSWRINVQANSKPVIKAVADDFVIGFGRLDFHRQVLGNPAPNQELLPVSFGNNSAMGVPIGPLPPGISPFPFGVPFGNLCTYLDSTAFSPLTCPTIFPPSGVGALAATWLFMCPNSPPGDSPDPSQFVNNFPAPGPGNPHGATCVFAIVGDANGDPLSAGFRIPDPLFGRGTLYAAIPVPNAASGGAAIPLLDNPTQTVASILPGGLFAGSVIDTFAKMDAYNATVSFLANAGLLPVTPPLSTYGPVLPLPAWPAPHVGGPQALPVIWEAPDDPDPAGTAHDCVTFRPNLCQLKRGGTVNVPAFVRDSFSPEQPAFATVAYPEAGVVFPDGGAFASIVAVPPAPAAFQGVNVTACLAPALAKVNIDFNIVGTDGFTKAQTISTGSDGCATFFIPGGALNVVDVVTAKLKTLTAQVTYVF